MTTPRMVPFAHYAHAAAIAPPDEIPLYPPGTAPKEVPRLKLLPFRIEVLAFEMNHDRHLGWTCTFRLGVISVEGGAPTVVNHTQVLDKGFFEFRRDPADAWRYFIRSMLIDAMKHEVDECLRHAESGAHLDDPHAIDRPQEAQAKGA